MANLDPYKVMSPEEMIQFIENKQRMERAEKAKMAAAFSSDYATVKPPVPITPPPTFNSGNWAQRSPGTSRNFTPATTVESPRHMYDLHPRGEGEFYGTPTVPLDQYEARTGVGSSQYQRDIAAQKLKGTIPGVPIQDRMSGPEMMAPQLTEEQLQARQHLEDATSNRQPGTAEEEIARANTQGTGQPHVPMEMDAHSPLGVMTDPEIAKYRPPGFWSSAGQIAGYGLKDIRDGVLLTDPKSLAETARTALNIEDAIANGMDPQQAQLAAAREALKDLPQLAGTSEGDMLIKERYDKLQRELGFIRQFPGVGEWLKHAVNEQIPIVEGYLDRKQALAIAAKLRQEGQMSSEMYETFVQAAGMLGQLIPGWIASYATGGLAGGAWFTAMIGGQDAADWNVAQWQKQETIGELQSLFEAGVTELGPELVAMQAWIKRAPKGSVRTKIPKNKAQLAVFIAEKLAKSVGLGFAAEGVQEGSTGVMQLFTDMNPAQRREAQKILSTRGVDAYISYVVNEVYNGIEDVGEKILHQITVGAVAGGMGRGAFVPLEVAPAAMQMKGAALVETVDALNRINRGEQLTETQQEYIDRLELRAKEHAEKIAPGVDVVITNDFIRDPRLEAEGTIPEGTYNRDTNQVVVSIPGTIDAMGDGARFTNFAPIMDAIRRVIGHEAIGHAGLNRFPKLTAKIYRDNEAAIKAWIDKSDYVHDFPDIDTNPNQQRNAAEEWVNSLSENDFKTNKKLGLAIKNFAGRVLPGDVSAETNVRNIVNDLATLTAEDLKGGVSAARFRLESREDMASQEALDAARADALAEVEAEADNVVPITRETATETIPELPLAASKKSTDKPLSEKGAARREATKKILTGAAVAAVPSLAATPATVPETTVIPTATGIPRASPVPGMVEAAEAGKLPPSEGLVSVNEAFDDYDADVAEAEDKAYQEKVDAYNEREAEAKRVEQEAKDKKKAEEKKIKDEKAKEDADTARYVKTVESIINVYDADSPISEAAEDGTLRDRIAMIASRTPYTVSELTDSIDRYIKSMSDGVAYSKKSRKDQTAEEKITGDVNDRSAKVFRPAIAALKIDPVERQARAELHKRLQKLFGAPARKRGVQAGNLQVYQQYAQEIIDGNLDVVGDFIAQFEPKLTGKAEKTRKAETRRAQRAKRLDKTDAEVMKYRPKGTRHPMEPKMSYPFARSEIDALEKAGDITAEEAEARRQGVNRIRRVFAGKAGQTVKRILAEMTYGIGNYTDIVPWSEVYTETEITEKGERAEIGAAQAKIERYDPTSLTTKEKMELLKKPETVEEKAWLDGDNMIELGSRRERLAFLRAPAEFKSPAEKAEFKAWQQDQKGFKQAEYKAKQAADREAQVKEAEKAGKVTRIPAKEGPFTPADARRMWTEKSNITNYDPTWFDRLKDDNLTEDDTTFTVAGQERTVQGEVVDLDSMSVDDDVVFSKKKKVTEPSLEVRQAALAALNGRGRYKKALFQRDDALAFRARDSFTTDVTGVYIQPESYFVVKEDGQIFKLNESEFDKATNPSEVKIRQAQKHKDWKQMVFDVTKRNSLAKATKQEKINVIYEWAKKYGTNPPDSIKGKLYEEVWGEDTKITAAVAEMNAHTRAKYWNREHGLEMDESASPETIIAYVEETLSPSERANFEKVFSDKNFTMMPAFLNRYKKDLNKITSSNELDAAQAVLNDWYRTLASILNNNEEVGFLEAHHQALEEFLKKHGDKFPKQTLPDFKVVDEYSEAEALNEFYNAAKDAEGQEASEGSIQNRINYVDNLLEAPFERAQALRANVALAEAAVDEISLSKKKRGGKKGYTEHFNDSFWYKITSFLYGKPVQAIRDVNKNTRFGAAKGTITAADQIADLIQRHHSSTQRAEGLEGGTDLVQDVSLRTGEFYSALSKIFAAATNRKGVIEPAENAELIDFLAGKDVSFSSPEIEQAATELKSLLGDVYAYAQQETKGLKEPLDLRGAGDTLIPRVWNIEWLATREGKAQFLKEISDKFSPPGSTTPIFADADITVDDLYDVVINSGGFVQGEWTNIKADQTRTEKDIEKDLKIQEYLDMLNTGDLIDIGLVLDDLQAVVPRFVQKAVERVEYAKRFGKNDEILRGLIKEGLEQIRVHNREALKLKKDEDPMPYIDEKKFEKSVWDMSRILRNKYGYDMANMPTRIWLQRLTNTATIAKLPLVALASMPEFFTPMLKGDVSPHHWFVDLMAATSWAGYKGMNGMSKLLFNKHLPAMRKYSSEIEGLGIISDVQLLRELGIADIQAMGDLVSTRYANPNFARGGLRAGAKGTLAAKVPKGVRAAFNMQTYMQATMLTTMTEMQQLMALRNFQRHVSTRLKFISENKGKTLTGRKANKLKQYKQDLMDYGITGDVDLDTSSGLAEFNSGALRFIDQVITRPNDATTAKAFKNPLVAPLVLFKRFITTFGNTLITSVGNDFANKVDNVERAKQVGKVATTAMAMYGAVMFAEIMRGAIKGDLDEDDFTLTGGDFNQFMRRLDRTGLLTAPGALAVNLAFPYKRGWWDSTESRIMGELTGPLGGDLTAAGDAILKNDLRGWHRLMGQLVPTLKHVVPAPPKKSRKKSKKKKGPTGGFN